MIRRHLLVRRWRAALGLAIACAFTPRPASAQIYVPHDVPRAGSLELTGGVVWSAGSDLGSVSADETRNSGTGTGPFVLFNTESQINAAIGLQGKFGVYLARSVSVEGGVLVTRPDLATKLSGDAESAPDLTATETLTRYVIDGSVLFHLTGASFSGGRGVPFVQGGGGYLRDAHEKNEVIETGHEFHVGGGLHYWFGQGKHRVGVRGDVGISVRSGGADANDKSRTTPTVAGSIAYLF
jgi:hypothetical protein